MVQQRAAFGAGVSEKDRDLAVLDLAGGTTVLHADASRFVAALAKAGFVNDHDRAWITQALQNVGTQIIAHQVCVPHGTVE